MGLNRIVKPRSTPFNPALPGSIHYQSTMLTRGSDQFPERICRSI